MPSRRRFAGLPPRSGRQYLLGKVPRPTRVLVVDDNLPLRLMVSQALEEHGYVTVAADSAEEALEAASFQPPDLCVIDFFMPGMSGAELIRELRGSVDERLRRVKVIGLTGYEGGDRELLLAGADLVLRKPWNEAALLAGVSQLMELRAAASAG